MSDYQLFLKDVVENYTDWDDKKKTKERIAEYTAYKAKSSSPNRLLQYQIDEYFDKDFKVGDDEDAKLVLKYAKDIINMTSNKLTSKNNLLTDIRGVIRKYEATKNTTAILMWSKVDEDYRINAKELDILQKLNDKRVVEKNENQYVFYSNDFKRLLDDTKDSSNISDKIIYVGLATGSRPVEIKETSNYSKHKNKRWITVKSFSKGKTAAAKEMKKNMVIHRMLPSGVKAKDVIQKVKEIREEYAVMKGKTTLQKKTKAKFIHLLKSYGYRDFKGIGPAFTRHLYINYMWKMHFNDVNISLPGFVRKYLDHGESISSASLSYTDVQIIDEDQMACEDRLKVAERKVSRLHRIAKQKPVKEQKVNKTPAANTVSFKDITVNKVVKGSSMAEKEEVIKANIKILLDNNVKISSNKIKQMGVGYVFSASFYKKWAPKNFNF